jgi:hypothetical protein
MLICFAVVAEMDAAKWPRRRHVADEERSGAFGTGSWTDTSPRNGCCIATLVAIREPLENSAAYREPVPSRRFAATSGSHTGTC